MGREIGLHALSELQYAEGLWLCGLRWNGHWAVRQKRKRSEDVFIHHSECGTYVPRLGDTVKFHMERLRVIRRGSNHVRRASNPKQFQAKPPGLDGEMQSRLCEVCALAFKAALCS